MTLPISIMPGAFPENFACPQSETTEIEEAQKNAREDLACARRVTRSWIGLLDQDMCAARNPSGGDAKTEKSLWEKDGMVVALTRLSENLIKLVKAEQEIAAGSGPAAVPQQEREQSLLEDRDILRRYLLVDGQ